MDSRTLVNYGINNIDKLELYNPLTSNRELIKNLFARILELKEIKRKEKARYNSPIQKNNYSIKNSITNLIKIIEKEIKDLETEINKIIKEDDELNLIYNTLTNIKGIKDKTAHTLITSLPELGRTNRKQIACICGLAPINNDSGIWTFYLKN